jgi:HTH-type transcriptional regulator/antitoxin HipB
MIQNDHQFEVTKDKLAKLAVSLEEMQSNPDPQLPEDVRRSDQFSLQYLMDELKAELVEYEKLRAGQVRCVALPSVLDDLPGALTRARIARGWTQRELAHSLGVREQQVQKDEQGGYAKASLARLRRVARVLGVRLSGEATFAIPNTAVAPAAEPCERIREATVT